MAFGWLQQALEFPDRGRKCAAATVLGVLLFAAARFTSIFRACQRLRDAPGDDALRNALVAGLPDLPELEKRLNRSLVAAIPKRVTKTPRPFAIDVTLIPYYGEPHARAAEIVRSRRDHGTTRFHAYATCYVVRKGHRYTIAITRVEKGESVDVVVRRLLRIARESGLKCKYLLLDREFFTAAVIRYLQLARVRFLMPVVHRGQAPNDPSTARGTRRFLARRRSGFDRHVIDKPKGGGPRVSFDVCICRENSRRKKTGPRTLVYAFWGLTSRNPRWYRETYRLRFGIETSYRQMNECRIRTCTRNPAHRLLFFAVAMLLRNLWVLLHAEVFATPRRGGRVPHPERLRLKDQLILLEHHVETVLGVVNHVVLHDQHLRRTK
jgi:putative transposase